MANLNRTLHHLVPLLLTLTSLTLLTLILLGARSPTTLPSLFFLSLNTSTFSLASYLPSPISAAYTISLWNYCSYNTTTTLPTTPNYCSPPTPSYHFDPLAIWSIHNSTLEPLLPATWSTSLATYASASKWLFVAYVAAFAITALTLLLLLLLVGVSSSSSSSSGRGLGQWATAVSATVAALLTAFASATATALFVTLKGFVAKQLGGYGVSSGLGVGMFVLTWVAVACSGGAAAAVVWVGGMCGSRGEERGRAGGDSGWGLRERGAEYERVPSPRRSPYTDRDETEAEAEAAGRRKGRARAGDVHVPLEQRWPGVVRGSDGKGWGYEPFSEEDERV